MNVPLIKIVTIKDFVRMICIWKFPSDTQSAQSVQ